ncbi:PREDICTED: EF-hand calcium-binding domain-containing protein 10-like [Branchiostoma belcheri]|uniref:EF-hand calcium-binding domain-containing protein 10-like n=1 Tax=Branchiostoma belcheri TaxID=7741 RepID=A0A6P4YWG1_BRABE|nr:PREDICTED: EF-hand calcium-binding domain-containing protein 10-like [Branchiostoma belcheri]KAI8504018.1 EF-hand calcium-binding domain-containing protein 10 [Branchiostoma belcheri]
MAAPREEEARAYLEEHKIIELFNNLTAQLVYSRPDNPRQYLIQYLERLRTSKLSQLDYPVLFDDTNLQALFGILDPTRKGFITLEQYKHAMENLGCVDYDPHPVGADADQINMDTFVREAKHGVTKSTASFKQ